jgi:hypothetical protein
MVDGVQTEINACTSKMVGSRADREGELPNGRMSDVLTILNLHNAFAVLVSSTFFFSPLIFCSSYFFSRLF